MKRPFYDQFCAASCALDLIGDRWTLLIARELLFSAKRFTDLLAGLPGIGTNTLTTRLGELEKSGIVLRRPLPPPFSGNLIELSERGRALEPVLVALVRWGTAPLLLSRPRHGLRPAWVGLALRSYFDKKSARGRRIRVALLLTQGSLVLELGKGALHITEHTTTEQPAQTVDLCITTSEHLLLDVLRGAVSLAGARRKGALTLQGDAQLLPRLLSAFPIGSLAAEP